MGIHTKTLNVVQEHRVTENGYSTYSDIKHSEAISSVPESVADAVWNEFGIEVEDYDIVIADSPEEAEEAVQEESEGAEEAQIRETEEESWSSDDVDEFLEEYQSADEADEPDWSELDYDELQAAAMERGIAGNQSTDDLVAALKEHESDSG